MTETATPQESAPDTGYAPPRWEFDAEVTRVFDDMLARSIPNYHEMRRLVFDVGSKFVEPKTDVVDLGCSRGEALAPFFDRFGAYVRFRGVEMSQPMLDAVRLRYKGWVDTGVALFENCDLRKNYPGVHASLTLSVLTLQFTPIEHRQRIIGNVFQHTASGGAFVLVEKVIGHNYGADQLLTKLYEAHKLDAGYTRDEIDRKALALEGVLVPVTAKWNEDLLRDAGFRTVECFWRHLNFAGWVAVK
jgi:tRNA (cmo5U34)-methyltransferase